MSTRNWFLFLFNTRSWPLWYGFCIDWVEGELEGFSVVCQGISEGKCRKHMWRRALIFYHLSPWMLILPGSRLSLEKKLLVVNAVRHHYHMLSRVIGDLWVSEERPGWEHHCYTFDDHQLLVFPVLYVVDLLPGSRGLDKAICWLLPEDSMTPSYGNHRRSWGLKGLSPREIELPWRSPSLILTWQSKPQVANLLVPRGLGCSSWTQELSYANTNYEFVFVLTSPFAFRPPKPTRRNLSRGFGQQCFCVCVCVCFNLFFIWFLLKWWILYLKDVNLWF